MLKRATKIEANDHIISGKLEEYLVMMCDMRLLARFQLLALVNQIDAEHLKKIPVGSDALEEFVHEKMKEENPLRTEDQKRFVESVASLIKINHRLMICQERLVLFVTFYLVIYHKDADVNALSRKVKAIVQYSNRSMESRERRMWILARDVEVLQDDINTQVVYKNF